LDAAGIAKSVRAAVQHVTVEVMRPAVRSERSLT
jgi:hypothetical protein